MRQTCYLKSADSRTIAIAARIRICSRCEKGIGHGSATYQITLDDKTDEAKPSPSALEKLFAVPKHNIRFIALNVSYFKLQARTIAKHIDCLNGMSEKKA